MGFTIKNKGKQQDPVPAEAHVGICYMLVDLGTQVNTKYDKIARKVVIGFEFPDVTGKRGDGTEYRRTLAKRFTASLHEKSALRKMLEQWRGKTFTDEELAGFDLREILGKEALVTVVHDKGDNGMTYANIAAIGPLPRALKGVHKQEGASVYFSIEDHGLNIPDDLPDWIKTAISESEEFKAAASGAADAEAVDAADEAVDNKPF